MSLRRRWDVMAASWSISVSVSLTRLSLMASGRVSQSTSLARFTLLASFWRALRMANSPTLNPTMLRKISTIRHADLILVRRRSTRSTKAWSFMSSSLTKRICPLTPLSSSSVSSSRVCCQRDQSIAWRTSGSATSQRPWKNSLLSVCMRELISAWASKKFRTPTSKGASDSNTSKSSSNLKHSPSLIVASLILALVDQMPRTPQSLATRGIHLQTKIMLVPHLERAVLETCRSWLSRPWEESQQKMKTLNMILSPWKGWRFLIVKN